MTTVTVEPVLVRLQPDDRAALDAERTELLAIVCPDAIADAREYAAVAEQQARVQAFIKRAKPEFDAVCDNAHKTWKSACNLRALFLDALETFNSRLRDRLSSYVEREERTRRDEERRIAEEERQREVARRKSEAKLLEAQGQKEMAKAVRAEPVEAPAVALPSAVPEVQGLSYREDWIWEPIGGDTPANRARALAMLVRPEVLTFVKLDDAGLTAFARRTKGTVKVPGIVFRSKQIPVRR